jgi:hypothetical protein
VDVDSQGRSEHGPQNGTGGGAGEERVHQVEMGLKIAHRDSLLNEAECRPVWLLAG